ncbi:MAG: response regulator, partial [Pseudomonadota bacterium]
MSRPAEQRILIINSTGASPLAEALGEQFNVRLLSDPTQARDESAQDIDAVLMDGCKGDYDCLSVCRQLKTEAGFADVPVILMLMVAGDIELMPLYDAGVDDVLTATMPRSELVARIQKAVFHRIANRQLHSRLMQANALAMSAMSDTSDLGVNIQFLVHCHNCNNLDELGMLLFRT